MGGTQSSLSAKGAEYGEGGKLATIALTTLAATSAVLYVYHKLTTESDVEHKKDKKDKKKKKKSIGNDDLLKPTPKNAQKSRPQTVSNRAGRGVDNRNQSNLGQSMYSHQSNQRQAVQTPQQQNDFRIVSGQQLIEQNGVRQSRNTNGKNNLLMRSEVAAQDRSNFFLSRDEQIANKTGSIKQLTYDNLSYTESNVEDSDEDGEFIEYEIKLKYDEDQVLSYSTLVQIFDKRQAIKGIKKMKHDFKLKRRKLLSENNVMQYKKVVILYKKAIESKLEDNLRFITHKVIPLALIYAIQLNLKIDQIEAAQEKHFTNADLTFILGIKEFLKNQVPSWLSGQRALEIYDEIKEITTQYADYEFQNTGKRVDFFGDDDDADVIKYKALDSICLKYHIEEEQIKHVLYVNFILPNQVETDDGVGGGDIRQSAGSYQQAYGYGRVQSPEFNDEQNYNSNRSSFQNRYRQQQNQ